ncbi:STY4851/ECs_5259 family protein [Frateuria sp. GZRe14]|uniref:STY4851/ECs_5259 family protein n=1 Tax=Frateuria sp. GZRe14 TaxID=3351534 RepID=UPI003EDBC0DE
MNSPRHGSAASEREAPAPNPHVRLTDVIETGTRGRDMVVIDRTAVRGPAAVLDRMLQARGLPAGPDGRALYRYECDPADLAALEAFLADALYPLEQRMRLVPLVAAERFRRSYREGPWSWDHCGPAIVALRRAGGLRFGPLLFQALNFWKLQVIRGDGMRRQFLETLVVNGGFPVAFVEGQSALRALLKRLIAEHVRNGEAAAQHRAALEIPVSRLPRGYRQSQDFERLCVELTGQLSLLARGHDPSFEPLSEYLEGVPGWESRLPLRLDSHEAKQLVEELLLTAREARNTGTLDSAVCIRKLHFEAGMWRAMTFLAPLPDSLELPGSEVPAVLRLGVTADGVAVRQLASLSRQPSGRYAVRPRPVDSQLRIPAPFDSPNIAIGLAATGAGYLSTLPVRDGDALDHEMPWVFVRRDAPIPGMPSEDWRFLAQGDARARDESVLLCIPEGSSVEGDAVDRGFIGLHSGRRQLVEVAGRTEVRCGGESFVIRTGDTADTVAIDLRGALLSLRSPDAPAVFAGAPTAQLREADPGTVVEWRSSHGSQWSPTLRDAIGLVVYRARVGEKVVARRKALVLPAQFELRLQPGNEFRLTLAPGWFAAGKPPSPRQAPDLTGQWYVAAEANPGQPAKATVMVRPPKNAPASVATIELRSHARTSGFRELVTGSVAPPRAALDEIGRYEAFIARHAGRLVHVSWGGNRTMPVACELEHADGFSLPLSWISDDLRDLQTSRELMDESLRLELFDRGSTSVLEIAPARLRRQGDRITVLGVRAVDKLELVVRHFSSDALAVLSRDPDLPGDWQLPGVFEPGWALVSANLPSIRPMAVLFGEEPGKPEEHSLASILQVDQSVDERIRMLRERLLAVAEEPLKPANDVDLAFLNSWLRRFRDVPGPYLDIVKALVDAPEAMVRLIAYSGAGSSDALVQRADESALWWHLVPVRTWQGLSTWWAKAMLGVNNSHAVDPAVFDSVVTACTESLHLSDADRGAFASVLQNAVVSQRLTQPQRVALGAQAASRYAHEFEQWNQCLATAEDGGARLSPLSALAEQASVVQRLLPAALPRACDPDRLPYLIAPVVCALAPDAGAVGPDLRRELVLARRFDRGLFDSLFALSRIQLACA